jgi:hypothetical protein
MKVIIIILTLLAGLLLVLKYVNTSTPIPGNRTPSMIVEGERSNIIMRQTIHKKAITDPIISHSVDVPSDKRSENEEEYVNKVLNDRKPRLALMSPSPEELKSIEAYLNIEAKRFYELSICPDDDTRQYKAHMRLQEAESKLSKELGEDRFREFKKVMQVGYMELFSLKQEMNLSEAQFHELWKIREGIREGFEKNMSSFDQMSNREWFDQRKKYRDAIVAIIGEENLIRGADVFSGLGPALLGIDGFNRKEQ